MYRRQGPDLGGVNLVYYYDFDQIRCLTRTGADALGSVHCQPTGWMRGRIAHPTSWLASSGPCVVKHSLVHKEQFVLHVDSAPRRGKADQPDAQQVRAARQPLRLRLTWTRFGRLPTPLPRAPTSPYLKLAMAHGCLTCAFPSTLARAAQLGSAALIDRNQRARTLAGWP